MTAIRHPALKDDRKRVLPAERQRAHLRGSQKALPRQNAHIPARRGMTGEEQESSPASVEPRVSTKHILLQIRSRSTGQPGGSPERHRQHGHSRRLQIVLLAASIILIKREFDGRKIVFPCVLTRKLTIRVPDKSAFGYPIMLMTGRVSVLFSSLCSL